MGILRDPAWDGIAAIIAIITLFFYLADKYSIQFRSYFRPFLEYLAFTLYGFTGGSLMILMFFLAKLLNSVFGDTIAIQGNVGELLLQLSQVEVFVWGFSSRQTTLSLQFGAFGLYVGSFLGMVMMAYIAIITRCNWRSLPFWYHSVSFAFFLFIIIVGIANVFMSF